MMDGQKIPNLDLFKYYDDRWEYCTLCNILAHRNWASRDGRGYLCKRHLELHRAEVAAGKFPPGLTPAGKKKFAEDETVWMRLCGLAFLVDNGKISEKEAHEEMDLYINMLNEDSDSTAGADVECEPKKMTPNTRLY